MAPGPQARSTDWRPWDSLLSVQTTEPRALSRRGKSSADYINGFLSLALESRIVRIDLLLAFYKGFFPRPLGSIFLIASKK